MIVIEDAALALGTDFQGKKIGSHGNTACFSLQARKIITTGEGGIILTSIDDIASKLKSLRNQGAISKKTNQDNFSLPDFKMLGLSYRLSDIQAAVGIIQMKRIEEFIEKRRKLAQHYNDLFTDSGLDIQTPPILDGVRQNFQTYVIVLNQGNRNKLIIELREKGIETTIGTYSLSTQPLFKTSEKYPVSQYVFENSLSLPLYHELTEENVDYIVSSIKSII
ncbi:MAG: DegT/DnrJ/EryC1/StrS family aminotransferase [Candidatus Thorarchaeota archaeon]